MDITMDIKMDDIDMELIKKHIFFSNKQQTINKETKQQTINKETKQQNKQQTKQQNKKQKKTIKKICEYNFISINEINICKILKKIENINNYCIFMSSCNFVNIGELNLKKYIYLDNQYSKNNEKYILCEYPHQKITQFNDFILNLPTPKLFFFHIIDSYVYLLKGLLQLHQNDICFLNISPLNIFFGENLKPLLNHFEKSILIKNLNQTYISEIIKNIEDFTHKPIEIYILFYLIENEEESLSYSLMNIIYENFIKNTIFSEENKKNSMDFLKKYINKPKSTIVNEILKFVKTWDNYSISFIYLHIFKHMANIFSLNNSFINNMINILERNISPNPLKRETLENTIQLYEKYFYETTDWNFINEIHNEKIHELFYKIIHE